LWQDSRKQAWLQGVGHKLRAAFMHINATVFIQAINFGITYVFLRNVLFKPVVQRIKQKDIAKNMLLDTLKDKEALLSNLQHEKTKNLSEFRQKTKKFYAIDVAYEQDIPATIDYKKDTTLKARIKQQTKELLVARVPHAY
jgi:F0F1-type ATP synthase membrane subunit b/b'